MTELPGSCRQAVVAGQFEIKRSILLIVRTKTAENRFFLDIGPGHGAMIEVIGNNLDHRSPEADIIVIIPLPVLKKVVLGSLDICSAFFLNCIEILGDTTDALAILMVLFEHKKETHPPDCLVM